VRLPETLEEQAALLRGKRIAVLAGGCSGEREVSLRSGAGILKALRSLGFTAEIIDPAAGLEAALSEWAPDVVFNTLHGAAGEDGVLQGYLEAKHIPYAGSGVLASALCMDKIATKHVLLGCGIPVPRYRVVTVSDSLKAAVEEIVATLKLPCVTKPPNEGSSLRVAYVKTEEELAAQIEALRRDYGCALVEEKISGAALTVGVLGMGPRLRALPVLQLVTKTEFYDYQAKYTQGLTEFVIPAAIAEESYRQAQEFAVKAHIALHCLGYSRADMSLDQEGIPRIYDVNTQPGMTELSDLPAQARAEGISYEELVLEMLCSCLARMPANP